MLIGTLLALVVHMDEVVLLLLTRMVWRVFVDQVAVGDLLVCEEVADQIHVPFDDVGPVSV